MAKCSYCGTTILFGGVTDGEFRYCNANCQSQDIYRQIAPQIPQDAVDEHVRLVHEGDCPRCGGPGPNDVYVAHSVWSAIAITSWKSLPTISCRSCGRKRQAGAAAMSAVVGWWGFPWGLFVTPIQIGRNLFGILKPTAAEPSAQLQSIARNMIVAHISQRAQAAEES